MDFFVDRTAVVPNAQVSGDRRRRDTRNDRIRPGAHHWRGSPNTDPRRDLFTSGRPKMIRTHTCAEFISQPMPAWAHRNVIALQLIELGKPNQIAYVESLNGRLRDKRFGEHSFTSLTHPRTAIQAWQRECEERLKKLPDGLVVSQHTRTLVSKVITRLEVSWATGYGKQRGVELEQNQRAELVRSIL